MEFGALHCTARKPLCETCALNAKFSARPEIWDALAGLPRRAKREPGCRYEDSNRFYRGRVLAKLRDVSEEGVELRSLRTELREAFADEDVPWIYGIVRSLEKDGLATVSGEVPAYAIGAVAEERAGYGTREDGEPKETRVKLP